MAELPDDIHDKLAELCKQGDLRAEAGNYAAALPLYQEALALISEPVEEYGETLWLYGAIGDAHFLSDDFTAAHQEFTRAIALPGALGNPFLHLRLGQLQYELGNHERAGDELTRAYAIGGEEMFEEDDPKYFDFLKTVIRL